MPDVEEYGEPFDPNVTVGKPVAEAVEFFKERGYTLRMTKVDGQPAICTRDYRIDRINVSVENGIVTELTGRG